MNLTKEEKQQEDITNDKYDLLNDTYAFMVEDHKDGGYHVKYCHFPEISKVGSRGKSIAELVSEAYENHLKKKS